MKNSDIIRANKLFGGVNFASLNFDEIEGEPLKKEAGEIVFRKSDSADALYLIIEGRVVLIRGTEKNTLGENDFFGTGVLKGDVYGETAVCDDDSFLLKISKEELENLISQNKKIEENILDYPKEKTIEKEPESVEKECPPCPEAEALPPVDVLTYEEAAEKFADTIIPKTEAALELIRKLEENNDDERLLEIEKNIRRLYEAGNVARLFAEGYGEYEMKTISVLDLVNEFIERFKMDFAFLNCEIFLDKEESHLVNVDRKAFYEAAKQILINACEATENKGEISIQISEDADFVEIQFSDNGFGIKAEHALDVFDPFVAIDKKALGLGLTVADKIIRAQKGKIAVKKTESGGAVISVFLQKVNETE